MTEQINDTKKLKFYSQKAIGIATFIGGPMAAGYLIRENYRSLEESGNGMKALFIGIIATILLFVGIFSVPETIMDKVPNQLLPAIYTGIIYLLVEKIHGPLLNQHQENGNEFYSAWKAVGIGFISLLILLAGIFGYVYLSTDNELYENYQKEMAIFTQNEKETLKFYENIDTKSSVYLLQELENFVIPKWEENIKLIDKTNAYEDLPPELADQNKLLMEYALLRIKVFKLLKKIIKENTDKYDAELDEIHIDMDKVLEKLN